MPYPAAGSPKEALADAIIDKLEADATLMAMIPGGIFTKLPEGSRATMPYLVIPSRESRGDGFAMQTPGAEAIVQLDTWSLVNTPHEVETIHARIRTVLLRQSLPALVGFTMFDGSLTLEEPELLFSDFDPDLPKRSLFHGVQRWTADLEQA